MAEFNENMSIRCPVCFAREIDVVLKRSTSNRWYCAKCSFTGDEATIKDMYADLRKRYRWLKKRVTVEELSGM